MEFLDCYFSTPLASNVILEDTSNYHGYLDSIQTEMSASTFSILRSGELKDTHVTSFKIDNYLKEGHELSDIVLTLVGQHRYTLHYQEINFFSMEKSFDPIHGFGVILVDECVADETGISHELVFEDKTSWLITCQQLIIKRHD